MAPPGGQQRPDASGCQPPELAIETPRVRLLWIEHRRASLLSQLAPSSDALLSAKAHDPVQSPRFLRLGLGWPLLCLFYRGQVAVVAAPRSCKVRSGNCCKSEIRTQLPVRLVAFASIPLIPRLR